MTRGAVRCSAWLGARLDSRETWKKSLEALELAGDNRTTGDGKLELSERMALRETKSLAVSRRVANQTPNRGRVCVVAEPRGSNDALGTNVALEARNIANALNLDNRDSWQSERGWAAHLQSYELGEGKALREP